MMDRFQDDFLKYKEGIIDSLECLDTESLKSFLAEIIDLARNGTRLYVLGNGGSAATASHFANDMFSLSHKFDSFKLSTTCLTDNVSIITSLGNDLDFEDIFVAQLKNSLRKEDGILILSASGNSENLVKAASFANEKGAKVLSIVGFDGGKIKELSNVSIHFQTPKGEYERSEDLHLFVNHFLRYFLQKNIELI